ncbi:hypothetical protein ABIA35_007216 [Catenulispora sp. MAP12-49]|uniref:hypothetical protein n=1 Tax=Catenulispora sp. MAP12-49 TaxID=3156302 RepID=UPI00351873C1
MDEVTGLAYRSAGDFSGVGRPHEIAELIALITEGLHGAGAPGELESVVVTGSRLHEVLHPVPSRAPMNTAVVVLALDRERSNLALAVREAADLAGSILI